MNYAFAQPSDAEIKQKVKNTFSAGDIISIKLFDPKVQKKWVKDRYITYWDKKYNVTLKTEYPGVTIINYGGARYIKSGSTYTFANMLTGGFDRYEGIPIPSVEEFNKILQEKYNPVNFYSNFLLGRIVEADKNIVLSEDPKFKWVGLNRLRCEVVSTYEMKTSDVGHMTVEKGIYQVFLERSEDGINYDENAKLLTDGKWLPIGKGFKKKTEIVRKYKLTKQEQQELKTLKESGAVQMAQEIKNSLVPLDLPDYEGTHHFMQSIHELLIEGDKKKIESLLYNYLADFYFEEWSDIVLNQRGKELFEKVLNNLDNYALAFCKHPHIKHIQAGQVSFYDRSKFRHNTIRVSYENERWYINDLSFYITKEDLAKHESSGENNCDGNIIYIAGEPEFGPGDPIEVFIDNRWIAGEVVKPEMRSGGYHVIYGVSGLKEWCFANNVRAREVSIKSKVSKEIPVKKKIKKIKVKVPSIKL